MSMLFTAVLCVLAISHVRIIQGQGRVNGAGTASVALPNTDVCGKRGDSSTRIKRIAGGSEANLGMFPWIAALGYTDQDSEISWLCAGSLVTDRHLVTAANCVVNSPRYNLSVVRLGELGISGMVTGKDYEVDTVAVHPGYNRTKPMNDIAVIRLKDKVNFSRLIQPICLPKPDEFRTKNFTGSAVYIAGWGRTDFAGPVPKRLLQAQVRVWGQQECKDAYKEAATAVIDNRVFCAGDNGKDSCQGDAGGPLMLPYGSGSNYYLYGIVSFGKTCGDPRYPGVYTRVSEFMDWIVPNLK